MSTKSDQLEWRRSKVVEMMARGLSHGEIARELQISRTSITSDVCNIYASRLKELSKNTLLSIYQVCLSALDTILKHAFEILHTSEDNGDCCFKHIIGLL